MKLRKAIPRCLRLPVAASLILALGVAPTARAFLFEFGDAKGSFDTTISVGTLYRLNAPDRANYGLANGGLQRSVNADDGDLNYPQGFSSYLLKANHDLLIKYKDAGLFVRGFYFNDFANSNGSRSHIVLGDEATKVVAEGADRGADPRAAELRRGHSKERHRVGRRPGGDRQDLSRRSDGGGGVEEGTGEPHYPDAARSGSGRSAPTHASAGDRPDWPATVFPAGDVALVQAGHATLGGIARDLRATAAEEVTQRRREPAGAHAR